MLKLHNKKDDAWSAFSGKVYNMSAYLPYHPGGEKELMRVAGRDGTKLFGESLLLPVIRTYARTTDGSHVSINTFLGQHRLHARWLPRWLSSSRFVTRGGLIDFTVC